MNLGDYFEQVGYHTDIRGMDGMLHAQAADLAQIMATDMKSLVESPSTSIRSAEDLKREVLKKQKESQTAHDYLEQSGLAGFDPVEPPGGLRYFRCGNCRWHWIPKQSYDNKCPRCAFVAPLKTYKGEEEPVSPKDQHDGAPPESQGSADYVAEIYRFIHTDEKTMAESMGIPPALRKLVAISYSVKAGNLAIEEAQVHVANATDALLACGYEGILSGLSNLERHYPAIAAEDAGVLSSIRKNTENIRGYKREFKKTRSKCFIATAAYGNEDAPEVRALREWRDLVLRRFAAGRACIFIYEFLSPPAAALLSRTSWLRHTCRSVIRILAGALTPLRWHDGGGQAARRAPCQNANRTRRANRV